MERTVEVDVVIVGKEHSQMAHAYDWFGQCVQLVAACI